VGTVDPPELMLLWSECYNQQRVNVAAGSGRTVVKQEFYAAAGGSIQRTEEVDIGSRQWQDSLNT